jgi:hypothetical protein
MPPRSRGSQQPPPQPPTAGFGYWDADTRRLPPQPPPEPPPEQQSPWEPTPQPPWEPWERWEAPPPPPPPYGYDDPYAYGAGGRGMSSPYGYGPVVTRQEARSKTRLTVLVVSTLLGLLLAAGGVYYMVEGETGGEAGASEAPAGASAGERPEGGKSGGAQDGDDENGKGGKEGENGAERPGNGAGGGDFAGQWRSRAGAVLTIGKEARSGRSAGKQAVSYNRPGALSTCPGVGEARKSGAVFRLALKCANGKADSELGGDAVRSGDKLTVEWDGGSKDAFIRRGTQIRSDG